MYHITPHLSSPQLIIDLGVHIPLSIHSHTQEDPWQQQPLRLVV